MNQTKTNGLRCILYEKSNMQVQNRTADPGTTQLSTNVFAWNKQ